MSDQKELRLQPPRGHKSPLWSHFGFEVDDTGKKVDEKVVRCRLCLREVGFSSNTSNLKQHLDKWHPDKVPTTSGGSSGVVQTSLKEFTKKTVKLPQSSH